MKIGLTGATGFIGSRIKALAEQQGWTVIGYSRTPRDGMRALPAEGPIDVSGLDAVLNLAGESIMGLWTEAKKARIRDSREQTTRRIVDAMKAQADGPRILINASAIGFYGETNEHTVDESSPAGTGFLAEICQQWEALAARAEPAGIRVVCVRIGFVLGHGGAIQMMKLPFSLGLGGNLGNGRQWMSGVHVDDVAGIFLHAAANESVKGPLNAVMPEPFRNAEFTREVGRALHRPAILPAPAFVLKLALGELSQIMLGSNRIIPTATLSSGYRFKYPDLKSALAESLG